MPYTIRTPEEKQALVSEWRASGVSLYRFARERGIPKSCLRLWAAGETLDARSGSNGDSRRETRFVEVEVVAPPEPVAASGFVVRVAGAGHRVEVPFGFDASELRRLVGALC